jgi:L-ascorbate metabolism protein UlaG (beta-lactamase superfamily)
MPNVQFLGHSCFLISDSDTSVLIDPFLTGNPKASCTADDVNPDAILLTHAHADHLGDAVAISQRTGAQIVAVFELAMYCGGQGADVHPMGIGGQRSFDWGTVKFVQAFHSSSIQTEDGFLYGGMPTGIVLTIDGKSIYHAGDTGLFSDMQLIGRRHSPDLAILPIGDNFTMGIDDAVEATIMIQPKKVVPMHFGTFPPIDVDPNEFKQKLADQAVECHVLEPGESLDV